MPSAELQAPLSNARSALESLVAEATHPNLDLATRVQVIEALGKWATDEVREPLIELLEDPAPEIRAAAANGLGWPGNSPAIDVLRHKVTDKTEQPAARAAAVGALVRIGDKSVWELLVETSRDPNPQLREEALRGLVCGPLDTASDRLALATRAAEDDELSLPFRADAIRCLTSTGDPAVLGTLLKILETGPRLRIKPPRPDASKQEILALRYQQIGDLRAWAAQGLGELGDRSVLPQLIKATEDPDDFFLRYVAAGVLTKWRECASLPALAKLLDDPALEVRAVAMIGVATVSDQCATIGDQSACQWLDVAYQKQVIEEGRLALHAARDVLKCL
jgi:HEAT repeat protein